MVNSFSSVLAALSRVLVFAFHGACPPPNKRLKLTARRRLRNEAFFSAPQLKRDPLGDRKRFVLGTMVVWGVRPFFKIKKHEPLNQMKMVRLTNGTNAVDL